MKTVGLIGGTGWVSTLEYYRLINEITNSRVGGLHAASCIIRSFNFEEIHQLQEKNEHDKIYDLLAGAAKNLVISGAQGIALCANTLHKYADKLTREIEVPLIHIAEATSRAIQQARLIQVGLLGTKITMEDNFYTSVLKSHDISVIIPDEKERDFIQHAIFNELVKGEFRDDTRERFLEIIDHLYLKGAAGIVLGCTEIPLLIRQQHVDLPLFNTLEIHAHAIVDFALG